MYGGKKGPRALGTFYKLFYELLLKKSQFDNAKSAHTCYLYLYSPSITLFHKLV